MKKVFNLLFLFSSVMTFAQKQADATLIGSWKLKSHIMSGVGNHSSLPKDTRLEFLSDGTWKSSESWEGTQQGKWSLKENKKMLTISFDPTGEKQFKVSMLTDGQLQLESSSKLASYKLSWEALK